MMPRKILNFVINGERFCMRCKKYKPNTLEFYADRNNSKIADATAQKICNACMQRKAGKMEEKGNSCAHKYNMHDELLLVSAPFDALEFSGVSQKWLCTKLPVQGNQLTRWVI